MQHPAFTSDDRDDLADYQAELADTPSDPALGYVDAYVDAAVAVGRDPAEALFEAQQLYQTFVNAQHPAQTNARNVLRCGLHQTGVI